MVDAGVPEQDAHVYAEGIRRGGTLVSVRTELPDDAQRILDSYASVNIQNRRSQLADSGWQNFNDPSRP